MTPPARTYFSENVMIGQGRAAERHRSPTPFPASHWSYPRPMARDPPASMRPGGCDVPGNSLAPACASPARSLVAAGLEVGQGHAPNKPRRWIVSRYFSMFDSSRHDTWVFGSRGTGRYLRRSPGRRSSGTARWPGGHLPMTPPWPGTGPRAASAAGAHFAEGYCYSPARTMNASGSSGTPPSARRSASMRSPP